MMLSNAFQSRTMESMRSRNLGKLSHGVELPPWSFAPLFCRKASWQDPGGGILDCNSPLFLSFFPFLFVRHLHHHTTLPAQGLPAGTAREGCTGSCRTRTRLAGAAPVAQPRWRLKWKRGCSPAARWRWRWRGLVLTSSRQDAVDQMAGSRGCASSDVANFSARGLPTQRRPEKTTINGPPMTAHPRQTQRKAGSPFLFHPALLGGRYLSHSSVLAIHEDRQPRRPQAKRRASVRL